MALATHLFRVILECLYSLLGRDLLTKMGTHIHFVPWKWKCCISMAPSMVLEEEYKLFPLYAPSLCPLLQKFLEEVPKVCAEKYPMGFALHQFPVLVLLKSGATPAQIWQYLMPREARTGITPNINQLREGGIMIPCQSASNTPPLLVKKPHYNAYWPCVGFNWVGGVCVCK